MDSNISAWSVGGAVFGFAALYVLFIAVAVALYIIYSRPSTIPGHRAGTLKRPVIQTRLPGLPARGPDAPSVSPRPTSPDRPPGAEGADEAGE
jgi:hypothetical protein